MSRTRLLTAWGAFLFTFAWPAISAARPGPAALWPSVLALSLAFITRHIYLSLFLGAWSGAILLRQGNPATSFLDLFEKHLMPALGDPWNVGVLVFTLLMGGLVEVLNANGGMAALAARIVGHDGSRKRAGLGAWIMGWLLFIDGLANAMLVGKTMRPAAERAGMSRHKLAFIVDSTSSPIAGLALISTWVAYELSVIQQGLDQADPTWAAANIPPLQILLESLPYRFYNYYILILVFLVIWRGRDFGPMVQAERDALSKSVSHSSLSSPVALPRRLGSSWLALGPLLVLVIGVFAGLFVQGGGLARPWSWSSVIQAFGQANAALVFVWATAGASLVAVAVSSWAQRLALDSQASPINAFFEGMQQMFLPALVLVLAWTLNSVLKEMNTASYAVSILGDALPVSLLPAVVFLLAALVSFGTGTSWGTMALVMPLVVPLAIGLAGATPGASETHILAATVGSVLAGAVFGDHCSPISDTTIVSAVSCGCGVMDHVRTQLPYALAAAGLAVILGYAPAGWMVSPWLLLPAGAAACWAVLEYLGKPIHDAKPDERAKI